MPHLYAANTHDVFFGQGFVHAQDRLWQMELNRRTATGRLSELFGPLALDTDRAARTFGFQRLGKADWANADADVRGALQVDYTCIPGREFGERLQGLSSADAEAQRAMELLRSWDGRRTAESVAGTLYEVTRHFLVRSLFEPARGRS